MEMQEATFVFYKTDQDQLFWYDLSDKEMLAMAKMIANELLN